MDFNIVFCFLVCFCFVLFCFFLGGGWGGGGLGENFIRQFLQYLLLLTYTYHTEKIRESELSQTLLARIVATGKSFEILVYQYILEGTL